LSNYIVKTKSGNRGPYSIGQLADFVTSGKLPHTAHVYHSVTGEGELLSDLLPAPAPEPDAHPPSIAPRRTPPARSGGATSPFKRKKNSVSTFLGVGCGGLLLVALLIAGWFNFKVNSALESAAAEINSMAPLEIDEGVTLTGAKVGPNHSLVLFLELRGVFAEETDRPTFETEAKVALLESVGSTNPALTIMQTHGISLAYHCRDMRGATIGVVEVHPSDL